MTIDQGVDARDAAQVQADAIRLTIAGELLTAEHDLLKAQHYDDGSHVKSHSCDGCKRAYQVRLERELIAAIGRRADHDV